MPELLLLSPSCFVKHQSLEVRLHRALEEVSKQKEAFRQTQGQSKDRGQGQRLEVARLEGHCQRLERQKVYYKHTTESNTILFFEVSADYEYP